MKHLYIHNGVVVASDEVKPQLAGKANRSNLTVSEHTQYMDGFFKALKQWEESLMPVKNACRYDEPNGIVINPDLSDYDVIASGAQSEGYEESGEWVVTKII